MNETSRKSLAWTRRLAFLVGLVVAAGLVAGWRPAGDSELPGLELRLLVHPTGALAVQPAGEVAAATDLRPGHGAARGDFAVRNETGQALRLRIRAAPPGHRADALVAVRIVAGERTLFRGRLGGLRRWHTTPLELGPGERRRLHLVAELPAPARGSAYAAEASNVLLELDQRWMARQ